MSPNSIQPVRTLQVQADRTLVTLDQTRLPFEERHLRLASASDCEHAIRSMQVRGAPLIGATAAFGLALALRDDPCDASLDEHFDLLAVTRPTAVNLLWALERVRRQVRGLPPSGRFEAAWSEACAIADEDVEINAAIGEHGARAIAGHRRGDGVLQVLTHCNAGAIATNGLGTALAPIYLLHEAGVAVHVWVGETRPRNQGARLTAWELGRAGVPHTIVADNAGGLLMMQGRVDAVIVGCDRVARNGDVANKIGTYLKALAARDNDVPFYVACPSPTIDTTLANGSLIPIEERSSREITHIDGVDQAGERHTVRITPADSAALNPAFDVTPAALVTAIVTERGACPASEDGMRALFPERFGSQQNRAESPEPAGPDFGTRHRSERRSDRGESEDR